MKILIVDGNNLAYKSWSVMKDSRGGLLKTSFGIPTTVVFSMIRTFSSLVQKMNFDNIIICWDTSGSYYRREVWEHYKRNRVYVDMKDYFEELDYAREHFKQFGFRQCTLKGIEADDLIGYIAHKFRKEGHKIIIVSDDKDYYQVVRFGIKIYRPIVDKFITIDDVLEEIEINPHRLPMVKALTGEDGDFIPGVNEVDLEHKKLVKCGLGPKTAMKIIEGRKSLSEAIEKWIDPAKTKKPWKEKLIEKRKMIMKSYKLARIRIKDAHYLDWELKLMNEKLPVLLKPRTVNLKEVVRLAEMLEFKSMNISYILRKLGVQIKGGSM